MGFAENKMNGRRMMQSIPKARASIMSSLFVISGRTLNALFNYLVTILILRTFTPHDFGIISVVTTSIVVLNMFMDFGASVSLVRFAALFKARKDEFNERLIYRSLFHLRIVLALIIIAVVWITAPYAGKFVLKDPGDYAYLRWAAVAAFFMSMTLFVQSVLQSGEKFKEYSAISMGEGFLKLTGIMIVVFILTPVISKVIAVYVLSAFALMIIAMAWFPNIKKLEKYDRSILSALFHYSKWYVISNLALLLFSNLDVLMIAYYRTSEEVGYYSGGLKIASLLTILSNTLVTVLMPKVSKYTEKKQLQHFIKKVWILAGGIVIVLAPLILSADFLINLIAGEGYEASVPIFKILFADHLFMIIMIPLFLLLFAMNRPEIYAVLAVMELILNIAGNIWLIPLKGAAGAAAVTLGVRIIVTIPAIIYAYVKIRSSDRFIKQVV